MEGFFTQVTTALAEKGLYVGVVIVATSATYFLLSHLLRKYIVKRAAPEQAQTENELVRAKRITTNVGLLISALKYVALAVAIYLISIEFVSTERLLPLAAGAGIFTVIVGIGAQSLVRDVISGFFFIFEGQMSVGDLVIVKTMHGVDNFGLVDDLSLRATTIQALNGDHHYIPNGNISQVIRIDNSFHTYFLKLIFFEHIDPSLVRVKIKPLLGHLKKEFPYLMHAPVIHSITHIANQTYVNMKFMMIPVHAESFQFIADNIVNLAKVELKPEQDPICEILTHETKMLKKVKDNMIIRERGA